MALAEFRQETTKTRRANAWNHGRGRSLGTNSLILLHGPNEGSGPSFAQSRRTCVVAVCIDRTCASYLFRQTTQTTSQALAMFSFVFGAGSEDHHRGPTMRSFK